MTTIDQAIVNACDQVGIHPPKVTTRFGHWMKTDTLSGKSGKGDGRVIVNEAHVTAWNWQTGEKVTVGLKDELSPVDRRKLAQDIETAKRKKKQRAREVAAKAQAMIAKSAPGQHTYLATKGFPHERGLVIEASAVREIAGEFGGYLFPEAGGERALVIPARIGSAVSSLQLIWEDGTKKFLAGGEMDLAAHRVSTGPFTWLCEGYATALSLRTALKGLHRNDCILCCFSAYNVLAVSRTFKRPSAILTDNDKPLTQFGGIGTGEYYARQASIPYLMPPQLGDDLNDVHLREGIFPVQRMVSNFLREATM
jgi:putative DNA primase/helicase